MNFPAIGVKNGSRCCEVNGRPSMYFLNLKEGSARLVFVWHSVYVYEDSFLKLIEDAMQG